MFKSRHRTETVRAARAGMSPKSQRMRSHSLNSTYAVSPISSPFQTSPRDVDRDKLAVRRVPVNAGSEAVIACHELAALR